METDVVVYSKCIGKIVTQVHRFDIDSIPQRYTTTIIDCTKPDHEKNDGTGYYTTFTHPA